jgi:hypothetical protein
MKATWCGVSVLQLDGGGPCQCHSGAAVSQVALQETDEDVSCGLWCLSSTRASGCSPPQHFGAAPGVAWNTCIGRWQQQQRVTLPSNRCICGWCAATAALLLWPRNGH